MNRANFGRPGTLYPGGFDAAGSERLLTSMANYWAGITADCRFARSQDDRMKVA